MAELLKDKVRETIEENLLIQEGDHVILGLSGGPDSLCLFHVLNTLKDELGFTLYAVHVNHKLRGADADADQTFVEKLCTDSGVTCVSYEVDCRGMAKTSGMSEEEAGRTARYDCFMRSATELSETGIPGDKIRIAVAQNLNDQAETLIYNMIRGAGTDGVGGMDYLRRDRSGFLVIRPLLDADRPSIEAYCREEGLVPRRDITNEESTYTRNRIRNELIPYLEENYNPNVRESLNRMCRIMRDDRAYLRSQAQKIYDEIATVSEDNILSISRDALKMQPPAIRHRILIRAFDNIGLHQDITSAHMMAADKLLETGQTSSQIDFPHGYILRIAYEKVEFRHREEEEKEIAPKRLKSSILYKEDYIPGEHQAAFDVDKIAEVYDFDGGPLNLIIARTRNSGDYIRLAVGKKTIQDFFVDEKVPAHLRDSVYMAAIGNEILWIPQGIIKERFTDNYKVTEETNRVLILEMDNDV